MTISEFRSNLKPGIKLTVGGNEFVVREVVKFRFDDGSFYIKCFLDDGYVLADDSNENIFLLVREVKTPFQLPFPENIRYEGNVFKYSYAAHAKAEEIWGEEIFKKGQSESFWDYKGKNDAYLSLGTIDETGERLDFFGKIFKPEDVHIE